jgi:hypothetical protein
MTEHSKVDTSRKGLDSQRALDVGFAPDMDNAKRWAAYRVISTTTATLTQQPLQLLIRIMKIALYSPHRVCPFLAIDRRPHLTLNVPIV